VDTYLPKSRTGRRSVTRRSGVGALAVLAIAAMIVASPANAPRTFSAAAIHLGPPDIKPSHPSTRVSTDRIVVLGGGAGLVRAARAVGATVVGHDAKLGLHVWRVKQGTAAAAVAHIRSQGKLEVEADVEGSLAATPNDPYYPVGAYRGGEWGFVNTKAATAWDTTKGASNVTIAIVDSGISAHPDLASHLLAGHNVLDNSADATDTLGHGTEAAGVAAAVTNNSTGIAGYCWMCSLMPVKVTNTSSVYMSDVATGITWATDHGAKVISLSLSSTSNSSALAAAVTYAQQHEVVVVAAAGNGGCNCPAYPAALPGVVSVAGSDYYDNLYSWSSYGSWVSVAAPGQNLTTALTDPATHAQWGYATAAGTSFATPVVAGEAALLASAAPNATAAELLNAILTGVDPVAGAHQVGHGRVDIPEALAALGLNGTPPTTTSATTVAPAPTTAAPATTTTPTTAPPPPATTTTVTLAPPATTATTALASTTQTTTFTGTLNGKNAKRTFSVTSGAGTSHAKLSFNCGTLSLAAKAPDGTAVGQANGPSVLSLDAVVPAGTDSWTVSSASKCTFTLVVTTPSP
jgi:subtilisin family serine protease